MNIVRYSALRKFVQSSCRGAIRSAQGSLLISCAKWGWSVFAAPQNRNTSNYGNQRRKGTFSNSDLQPISPIKSGLAISHALSWMAAITTSAWFWICFLEKLFLIKSQKRTVHSLLHLLSEKRGSYVALKPASCSIVIVEPSIPPIGFSKCFMIMQLCNLFLIQAGPMTMRLPNRSLHHLKRKNFIGETIPPNQLSRKASSPILNFTIQDGLIAPWKIGRHAKWRVTHKSNCIIPVCSWLTGVRIPEIFRFTIQFQVFCFLCLILIADTEMVETLTLLCFEISAKTRKLV